MTATDDVDVADLMIIQRSGDAEDLAWWRQHFPTGTGGDFDLDGDVDIADLMAIQRGGTAQDLAEWRDGFSGGGGFGCCGGAGAGGVLPGGCGIAPEPSALAAGFLWFTQLSMPTSADLRGHGTRSRFFFDSPDASAFGSSERHGVDCRGLPLWGTVAGA